MDVRGDKLHILSVEDNPADRYLIRHFFASRPSRVQLHFTEDGCAALDFVFKQGPYQNVPVPDLILLDLNLPKKDGKEVLKELKQIPDTKSIPVFILSTSRSAEDKKRCLELGAEQFLTKPSDIQAFDATLKTVESWLEDKVKTNSGG